MRCYYHKTGDINKEKILKSTKEFNRIKNIIENKIMKSKDELKNETFARYSINDAYEDAILVFENQSNFGAYFSTALKNYRKEKNVEIDFIDNKIEDKYFVEKYFKELKDELEKIIRTLKPRRKFYFCLRHLITFEKPKNEIEEKINRIIKKRDGVKFTFREIGEKFGWALSKKKSSKQSVEDVLKRTELIINNTIKENKKIKELLKEVLY